MILIEKKLENFFLMVADFILFDVKNVDNTVLNYFQVFLIHFDVMSYKKVELFALLCLQKIG